ncbi:MAG: hypothetical protein EOO39_44755 [Cytophagaceae bacterium]|nr:MAG: hypothetical protein EOO39_44755 [Cytophagaceae bacterium]
MFDIVLLKIMLTKIRRQDRLDRYPSFPLRSYNSDNNEGEFYYPPIFSSYVLTLPSKSFKGHSKALGIELTKLAKALHTNTLIFLGDTETPWLVQHNNYKPANEAQEYLTKQKIGRRFNGALQVDISELPIFTKHIAWLIRCNATLPDFHFTDEGQTIIGSICQYGNLHLDMLDGPSDGILMAFVDSSKFQYGNENSCHNWFSKTSAILGRRTVL